MDTSWATKIKWLAGVVLASCLLFLSFYFRWLTPFPLLLAYKKQGPRLAVVAWVLGAVCLYFVLQYALPQWTSMDDVLTSNFSEGSISHQGSQGAVFLNSVTSIMVFFYLIYGLMGMLLPALEIKVKDFTQLIGSVVLIAMAITFVWLWIQVEGDWRGLAYQLESGVSQMMFQFKSGHPLATEEKTRAYYLVRVLPAATIGSMIFVSWFNLVAARNFLQKEKIFQHLGDLTQWRMPFIGVWITILAAMALLIDYYWLSSGALLLIAANALIVLAFIYFFQGISIMVFFSKKWIKSPLGKIFFYVSFLFLFPYVLPLLMALGFFDAWFEFRKMARKKPLDSP